MKHTYLFAPMILLALACGRPPHAPPLATTVAVVEFGVAPNATIERFSGDPPSLGVFLAKAAAEEIRDDNDDDKPFDATVVPRAAAAEGDLIVRGEITHVYGGNGWVQATVLLCTVCGWWTGNPRLGFQGTVTRRDGTVVAVFSDETTGLAEQAGKAIGEMVKEGEYHGGHPGDDGYLTPVVATSAMPAGQAPPAERLRALDSLRNQGLISDPEYTEKRKQILQEF